MPSIGFWQWYIKVTIIILDIIHRPVFKLKHDILETWVCLFLDVETTQIGGSSTEYV
jgi:hypothetical protein